MSETGVTWPRAYCRIYRLIVNAGLWIDSHSSYHPCSEQIYFLLPQPKESITIAECCTKTSVKAWYSTDVFKEASGQLFPSLKGSYKVTRNLSTSFFCHLNFNSLVHSES